MEASRHLAFMIIQQLLKNPLVTIRESGKKNAFVRTFVEDVQAMVCLAIAVEIANRYSGTLFVELLLVESSISRFDVYVLEIENAMTRKPVQQCSPK